MNRFNAGGSSPTWSPASLVYRAENMDEDSANVTIRHPVHKYMHIYVTLVFSRYPFSIFGCNFPMSFHHHYASFTCLMWIQGKGPPACGWLVQVFWYLVCCGGRTPLMVTPVSQFREGVLLVRTPTSVTGLFIGIIYRVITISRLIASHILDLVPHHATLEG